MTTATLPVKTFDLFGGAITTVLPADLIDASTLREVPDTQEVLLSPDSDISYIVEVLERVAVDDPIEAVKFHFDSLAHDNSALSFVVDYTSYTPGPVENSVDPVPITLIGSQKIQKFNKLNPDDVKLLVALFRIESKNTDVVFTCNVPIVAGEGGTTEGVGQAGFEFATRVFEKAVQEFKIVDYGLFA